MKSIESSRQIRCLLVITFYLLLCIMPCLGLSDQKSISTEEVAEKEIRFTVAEFSLIPKEIRSSDNLPVFTLKSNPKRIPMDSPVFTDTKDTIKEIDPQVLEKIPKKLKFNRLEDTLYSSTLISLTALNIADYISTILALQHKDLKEGNPLMKPFTKNIMVFSAVKLGLTIYDFHILKKIHKKNKIAGWVLSVLGNVVMSFIVSNNIRKLKNVASY